MIAIVSFNDEKGSRVELTFGRNRFNMPARHVLVVLKHNDKWLLTLNRKRGIEFPGGKAEEGEAIEEAAIREVIEETGVTITNLTKFAEYVVESEEPFCKAVFTAEVAAIEEHPELHETEGAVWMTDLELNSCLNLSFYMKDEGMPAIREWVNMYEQRRLN
ncbi:NUDIX domain-containing protein [Sporosarcina sp. CAU 1771]